MLIQCQKTALINVTIFNQEQSLEIGQDTQLATYKHVYFQLLKFVLHLL